MQIPLVSPHSSHVTQLQDTCPISESLCFVSGEAPFLSLQSPSPCLLPLPPLSLEKMCVCVKRVLLRAGEMVQWLRTLAALPEDPGSILSTHIVAHNCLWLSSRDSDTFTPNAHIIKLNKLQENRESFCAASTGSQHLSSICSCSMMNH